MTYIAAVQREFNELGVYNEHEKIPIIRNGLNDRLRDIAMTQPWASVQEMDLHLRTVEAADELRRESEVKPIKKMFFPRRSVSVVETNDSVECEESIECEATSECEHEESELNSDCQAIRRTLNFKRDKFHGQKSKPTSATAAKDSEVGIQPNTTVETRKPKLLCYNCKSDEHLLLDCTTPIDRVFCFRCGNEGVRAPECSCRRPKNECPAAYYVNVIGGEPYYFLAPLYPNQSQENLGIFH